MKKLKNLLGLFIAAILLVSMFAACEGPEGPAGPKGDPGEQGEPGENVVNWEGFKEGIKCGDCHNPDTDTVYNVWGRKYQWILSKHSYGGDFERNSSSCSNCHTTEGFIQAWQGKTVTSHVNGSPPGCFACHSPHSRAEFSLRTVDPVTILSAIEGVPDLAFDYGKGNLCAACHKTRTMTNPKPDPTKTASTDTIKITSNRWYPHYGVQGQMLAGEGGFEFQGYTYTNSYHTIAQPILDNGCALCHMAEPVAGNGMGGGHTMNIRYEGTHGEEQQLVSGCTVSGCHSAPMVIDFEGKQTETLELLDSLQTLLLANEWIYDSGEGYLVNAGSSSPRGGTLKIAPAYLSGALFNYFFIEHDLSLGVHNTNYAQQLLETSIAKLTEE